MLLVEDNDMVRAYALSQLLALGYEALEAPDGSAAMKILQQRNDIELLFTDVVMPGGMNGKELAEAALRLHPGIKVLLTSGYTEDVLMEQGRLASNLPLLTKPYTRADLAAALRNALEK